MRNGRESGPLLSLEHLRVNFTVLIYTKKQRNVEIGESERR